MACTGYSNKCHSDIDFSFEREKKGNLSFLDVEVSRKGRNLLQLSNDIRSKGKRWLTFLLGSLSVGLTVLAFWLSLFLLTQSIVSLTLKNFHYVVVSGSTEFLSTSKEDPPVHLTAFYYSCDDWDGLWDHLRDVPWKNIFKVCASCDGAELCERVEVGNNVYISHSIYQVKPYSPSCFSAASADTVTHRNHLFHLYQQNKSYASKVKLRLASIRCERVLEAAKLACAKKTKESITSQKHESRDFWRITYIVLNKVNLAIPCLLNAPKVLSSGFDREKLFAEFFL